ncbi:MAG: sortase [SAR202 cluster bacterium]|nr:sortase [SAR202 cluster bacterium]
MLKRLTARLKTRRAAVIAAWLLVLSGLGVAAGMPLFYWRQDQSADRFLTQLTAQVASLQDTPSYLPLPSENDSIAIDLPTPPNPAAPGTPIAASQEPAPSPEPRVDPAYTSPAPIPTATPKPPAKEKISVNAFGKTYIFESLQDTLPSLGALPPAERILVPSIDVDAPVNTLDLIKDEDNKLYYQQPKGSIGRIETAGNPGEGARGWYFGHIRSSGPSDEKFEQLPSVMDKITNGEPVDVILFAGGSAYLYRAYGKPVILTSVEMDSGYFHKNLYAPKAEIVLVTCVPPNKPTHRFLMTAELIGVAEL